MTQGTADTDHCNERAEGKTPHDVRCQVKQGAHRYTDWRRRKETQEHERERQT